MQIMNPDDFEDHLASHLVQTRNIVDIIDFVNYWLDFIRERSFEITEQYVSNYRV